MTAFETVTTNQQAVERGAHFSKEVNQVWEARSNQAVDVLKGAGIQLLNKNIDKIGTLAHFLPDGKINVGDWVNNPLVAGALPEDQLALLRNFDSITKNGDHYNFVAKKDSHYPIEATIPGTGGFLKTENVHFGKEFSFDLKEDGSGHTKIDKIHGIDVGVTTSLGGHISAKINEIDLAHTAGGRPEATVKAVAPIVGPLTEKVPFEIKPNGTVKLG
jgi:hypothetical protein